MSNDTSLIVIVKSSISSSQHDFEKNYFYYVTQFAKLNIRLFNEAYT
ncbi:hypothetical protein ACUXHF_001595 [Staphylococcus epidermidis]|uniref:Uncharacterized protein n=1 Tax=Staphylococcus epidermidis (strain ATCC 35984 / DSM 28319 / BCRC 17069 / CCUG 31568 / BM 3577 / RP62A) TaxID=176279 RepID=Q5HKU4_STAEQ|nr:hypothetical protein SERP2248 [Staphylococcus epidermidis RP62A]EFA86999.1 hypothetical protein HMPREF0797_0671 [Staphylococcus epidermidis SK135]EGS80932.1 hypothetical protein SEVCU107_0810 [Staphylococcus epidermidis VCU109]EPZ44541.1 hypothetical protein HMPREF1157_0402 [Staphylococcus epidermidis E13A]KDP64053.1 hypothetical protein SEVCU036_0440 [Staphylococcus epidermidis VCU036]SFG56054.1 hypothetical protein SAMN04487862_10643 [Staphylococcus epidermidis]